MLAFIVFSCLIAFLLAVLVGIFTLHAQGRADFLDSENTHQSSLRIKLCPELFRSAYVYFCFFLILILSLFFLFNSENTPNSAHYALSFPFSYAVLMFLCVLGLIDLKCLALPDVLNFLFLLLCIGCTLFYANPIESILLGFGLGGVAFTLKIAYQSLTGKDILGEADILVLSALGMVYGVFDTFLALFGGSVIALAYGLIIFARTREKDLKLPFVFFIFLGQCLNHFFDTPLAEFFFNA